MFALKKLISAFLLPLPAALSLIAVALCLFWFTKRQRAGNVLVTIAFGLLLPLSLPAMAPDCSPRVPSLAPLTFGYGISASRRAPGRGTSADLT